MNVLSKLYGVMWHLPHAPRMLCSIVAWICSIMIVYAGSFDYTIGLDPDILYEKEVAAEDSNNYICLKWGDMNKTEEIGSPELPVKFLRFMVPTYCNNIALSLKTATLYETRRIGHLIYPVQEQIMTKDVALPEFVSPDKNAYERNVGVPELKIVGEDFIDGFNHVVTVMVSPVVYRAQSNEIDIYGDITFTISYTECGENDMAEKPIFPTRYTPFYSLDDNILDPGNIKRANSRRYAAAKASSSGLPEYYYVIVPKSLKNAITDFATWKMQKGYTVVVKTIEEILAMPDFKVDPDKTMWGNQLVDEAASLRAYLRGEYEKYGFFYCLLVGNNKTSMPIRKCVTSPSKIKYDDGEGYIPTDNYFTDLKYNWRLTKRSGSSIYSDANPTSFSPQICTGRLLCSTAKEIENWFNKVRLYEANPGYGDNDYLSQALFFEQWSWNWESNYSNSIIGDSEAVRNFLDGTYYNCELIEDPARDKNDYKLGISGRDLISKIGKVGLSSWHGHGTPAGVACSWGTYYITSEDSVFQIFKPHTGMMVDEVGNGIDNLGNSHKPSIVYSIACDNIPFDDLTTNDGVVWKCKYNMGEAFTVAGDFGGPVFLGNTRVGYVKSSAAMELLFFKGLVNNRKVGYAENYSKINYSSSHIRATHSLIGDPEIEMWIGKPLNASINIAQSNSDVSFSGNDLSGAKINVYDGNGKSTTATATTNSFSYTLSGAPTGFDTDTYVVSIWKTGYLPIIKLFGQNASLSNKTRSFIVRDAILGSNIMTSKTSGDYIVGKEGILNVKAIDSVSLEKGFVVDEGGKATFDCDRSVAMKGVKVNNGGNLVVNGEFITLEDDFTVMEGGSLTIQP